MKKGLAGDCPMASPATLFKKTLHCVSKTGDGIRRPGIQATDYSLVTIKEASIRGTSGG